MIYFLTGIWKEDRLRKKNIVEFFEVLDPGNLALSYYKKMKCGYLEFTFDPTNSRNVEIAGSLGRLEGITREKHQIDYQITADNETSYEMQPIHIQSSLQQNVIFNLEGSILTAFHRNNTVTKDAMENPVNFIIEWKTTRLNEMTERFYHIPTKTEAFSYFDREQDQSVTLYDVRKQYYDWCHD